MLMRSSHVMSLVTAVLLTAPPALVVGREGADTHALSGAKGKLLARIGSREVYESDFGRILDQLALIGRQRPGAIDEATKAFMVRQYVTDEVLWQKALGVGLGGLSAAANVNRHDVARAYLNAEIDRRLSNDPPDVEQYYQEHIKAFTEPNRAKVQFIKLRAEEGAEKILEGVRRGEEFSKLAPENSGVVEDAERSVLASSAADDWGYVSGIGSFPAATEVIFSLPAGAVTPRPIQRADFWYLFKVESFVPAKNKPFEEIKDAVRVVCTEVRRKELKPQIIGEELKAAGVEFYLGPPAAMSAADRR